MNKKLPKNYQGVVEQLIRPTGLVDPVIDVRPALSSRFVELKKSVLENKYYQMSVVQKDFNPKNQIDDLLAEIKKTIENKHRVLVTTLTKRMAEELTNFLMDLNIKVQYIHSDVDTIERVEILSDLRRGVYDVIVGINLLREGLDLPEVSLVAILDADKEGFLRSRVSLIQTIGRAARHSEGRVIMYADKITDSMKIAIDETLRRRKVQLDFNQKNNITPQTIIKDIKSHVIRNEMSEEKQKNSSLDELIKRSESYKLMSKKERKEYIAQLDLQMKIFADMLEFEMAVKIRDIKLNLNS